MERISWLSDEERNYLLLILANGSIAFVPAQDVALARLLELGLVETETVSEDCIILRLSAYGHEVAAGLSP